MRRTTVIIASISLMLFVVCALIAFLFSPWRAHWATQPSITLTDSPETREAYWDYLNTFDAKTAYDLFSRAVVKAPVVEQHVLAHHFARELYRAQGSDSIRVCDERFNYGCLHEFIIQKIVEEGVTVSQLLHACGPVGAEGTGTCRHGALATQGYDRASLVRALESCTQGDSPDGQCVDGVFMEYTQRSIGVEKTDVRPYTGVWDEPCEEIPEQYLPGCFGRLPHWWMALRDPDVSLIDFFGVMGERCRSLSDNARSLERCFGMIGKDATLASNYHVELTSMLCDASATREQERAECYRFAALMYAVEAGMISDAVRLCSLLDSPLSPYCAELAREQPRFKNIDALP
jgi:hypothetical protein